jgi:hypothetical protein
VRVNYAYPEGNWEPEPQNRRKSDFERTRDERSDRYLRSLQEALVTLQRAASR